MCMQLYIGVDNELTDASSWLLPWKLNTKYEDDNFADKHLTKKYKYGLMGCACNMGFDFSVERFDEAANIDYNEDGKQAIEKLFEYIKTNVEADNCELLSFWSGEYKMEHNDTIDLKSFILGDKFEFLEGQRIVVYK